jgi:hypothetical protein
MKRNKQILTAAILSASVGLGVQSILAQTGPSGPAGPANPKGPVVPQPTQPTIPGQPAPGIPQPDRIPGQPGTIPERVQAPNAGNQNMLVTSDDIKKAQDALRAKGLNPGTDGRMDAKTQDALREFQKSNNLPATGVLDDRTAEKLGVSHSKNSDSIPGRGSSSTGPSNSLPKTDKAPR